MRTERLGAARSLSACCLLAAAVHAPPSSQGSNSPLIRQMTATVKDSGSPLAGIPKPISIFCSGSARQQVACSCRPPCPNAFNEQRCMQRYTSWMTASLRRADHSRAGRGLCKGLSAHTALRGPSSQVCRRRHPKRRRDWPAPEAPASTPRGSRPHIQSCDRDHGRDRVCESVRVRVGIPVT